MLKPEGGSTKRAANFVDSDDLSSFTMGALMMLAEETHAAARTLSTINRPMLEIYGWYTPQ